VKIGTQTYIILFAIAIAAVSMTAPRGSTPFSGRSPETDLDDFSACSQVSAVNGLTAAPVPRPTCNSRSAPALNLESLVKRSPPLHTAKRRD
jgi:hypothetical protein